MPTYYFRDIIFLFVLGFNLLVKPKFSSIYLHSSLNCNVQDSVQCENDQNRYNNSTIRVCSCVVILHCVALQKKNFFHDEKTNKKHNIALRKVMGKRIGIEEKFYMLRNVSQNKNFFTVSLCSGYSFGTLSFDSRRRLRAYD